MLGGFIFGVGAAINGACAYATMARLVDGEGGMLVTIAGFALGVLCFVGLLSLHWVARPVQSPGARRLGDRLCRADRGRRADVVPLRGAFGSGAHGRREPASPPSPFARQYRLSTTALIMGGATAALVLLFGPLGYTSTFEQVIEAVIGVRGWPTTVRWVILASVLAGMLLSTVQRGTFRVDWRPRRSWLRNFSGGVLMGLGVALTPGGNDALVLYGVPSLSPHALPALSRHGDRRRCGAAPDALGARDRNARDLPQRPVHQRSGPRRYAIAGEELTHQNLSIQGRTSISHDHALCG